MLGYGSFLDSLNTAKAAVTSAYLGKSYSGVDAIADADNPLVFKILDMLGYGSFLASSNTAKAAITSAYLGQSYSGTDAITDATNPLVYSKSQTVNLLPLLAYQKIYYDFFSESQWEKHLAYAYTVDYWNGESQLNLAPEMLQLRYANYPKDYFMGMLPASQYGSVAVLPGYLSSDDSSRIFAYDSGSGSLGPIVTLLS